jgi:hypothetical protein
MLPSASAISPPSPFSIRQAVIGKPESCPHITAGARLYGIPVLRQNTVFETIPDSSADTGEKQKVRSKTLDGNRTPSTTDATEERISGRATVTSLENIISGISITIATDGKIYFIKASFLNDIFPSSVICLSEVIFWNFSAIL